MIRIHLIRPTCANVVSFALSFLFQVDTGDNKIGPSWFPRAGRPEPFLRVVHNERSLFCFCSSRPGALHWEAGRFISLCFAGAFRPRPRCFFIVFPGTAISNHNHRNRGGWIRTPLDSTLLGLPAFSPLSACVVAPLVSSFFHTRLV